MPQRLGLSAVPADSGVQTSYRYSVVNDRTVLVEPQIRRVVRVIE
jgi:hypothetical protein